MKLIVRAADYAMTDSITDGCLKAIRDGILTDVGLMTNNAEHAQRAVREVLNYPHVSIGQDLNLVSGVPASDPRAIPSLVDSEGRFLSSTFRKTHNRYDIPYDEIMREMKAQVERFIELVGRKPVYIAGHSLATPEVCAGHGRNLQGIRNCLRLFFPNPICRPAIAGITSVRPSIPTTASRPTAAGSGGYRRHRTHCERGIESGSAGSEIRCWRRIADTAMESC